MSTPSKFFDLSVVYESVEGGRVQATIPAVRGTISVGRTRSEARENVLDALRLMLSAPSEQRGRTGAVEQLRVRLDVTARDVGREL